MAATLFMKEDYPSWLYAVNMGATTIWERWNSVEEDGSMSQAINSALFGWDPYFCLTVFLVEQNAFAALKLSDRGYVMVNGKVTMSGPSKELLANPEIRAAYLEGGHH